MDSTAARFMTATPTSVATTVALRPTVEVTAPLAVLVLRAGAALIALPLEAEPLVESVAAAKHAAILPVAELASAAVAFMAAAASTVGAATEEAGINPAVLSKIR